jgi:hypothetical protein
LYTTPGLTTPASCTKLESECPDADAGTGTGTGTGSDQDAGAKK